MSSHLTNEHRDTDAMSWTEPQSFCGACGGHGHWIEFHNGAKVRVPCHVCNKTALDRLACWLGFHDWQWDSEAGASGHSMDEAISFLYANLYRCKRCPKTKWVRK